MKAKKINIAIAVFLALASLTAVSAITLSWADFWQPSKPEIKEIGEEDWSDKEKSLTLYSYFNKPISAQYTDGSVFLSAIKNAKTQPTSKIINGLVVPHHLLAVDVIANSFSYISLGDYKNIVLIGPDHFSAGEKEISVTERDFLTVFGTVATDKKIVKKLKELPFVGEGDFFYREHGLGAELPFLKYYFPDVKVTAITFKSTVSKDKLDQVIAILEKNLTPNSLVIESTDFSHYLTGSEAEIKDAESISVIESEDAARVLNLNQPSNIDSRAALYVQAVLQKDFFKTSPLILEHKNSQDYTAEKVASSTSYLAAAYQSKIKTAGDADFIFVGDVMLSRHIGELMAKKQNYDFPYEKIKDDLVGADLVFGNLETPVSTKGESAHTLYSFRADPLVLSGLKNAGFKVVSVANNHAFDYKIGAFADTLINLKEAGIAYTGGGNDFNEAHSGAIMDINGIKTTFLAYTNLLPKSAAATDSQAGYAYLDEAQMVKDIAAAKDKSDLVIVSFHWGQEYQTKSGAYQQKVAKTAVEAGADLIIGHHPHVAQEIGEIDGITVAYSLGNFIFDQNFSEDTRNALILKVKITDKKITEIKPEKIKFTASFQPYLIKP